MASSPGLRASACDGYTKDDRSGPRRPIWFPQVLLAGEGGPGPILERCDCRGTRISLIYSTRVHEGYLGIIQPTLVSPSYRLYHAGNARGSVLCAGVVALRPIIHHHPHTRFHMNWERYVLVLGLANCCSLTFTCCVETKQAFVQMSSTTKTTAAKLGTSAECRKIQGERGLLSTLGYVDELARSREREGSVPSQPICLTAVPPVPFSVVPGVPRTKTTDPFLVSGIRPLPMSSSHITLLPFLSAAEGTQDSARSAAGHGQFFPKQPSKSSPFASSSIQ